MSTNQDVAEIFRQIATALELLEANRFRINGYNRVSRVVKDLSEDVASLVKEHPPSAVQRLTAFDGIGKGSAEKIVEYVETGQCEEHQQLLAKVPEGLFEILQIPGVGPKAAKAMWQELGIESLADLKARLDSPELARMPRMGVKTIDNIKKAIDFAERTRDRIPLGVARPIALRLREELRQVAGVRRLDFAGSLRRGRETIGDLDFLASCDDPEALRQRFVTLPEVTQVLAQGETKSSVRLESGRVALQADLRIVPDEVYGAALMYFTGSKEHNVRLREIAIRQNRRLNEYGLYEGTDERPQDRGAEPVAAATEEAIYQALGLPWIAPELREDRGELDGEPPRLIEIDTIRAELHAHTVASDGKLTIEELADCARRRGFHTLAVTDHSRSSVIAGGLDPEQLLEHIEAVHAADSKVAGIKLLAGSEVDILGDGQLDYDDELLARLDVVVASPHASLRQDPAAATARLLRAIHHPLVHIIGHPTGRVVNRREGLSPDMKALFAAAAETDTALELNANWRRLDLRDSHLRGALAQGCKIAIDTDAHRERDFDNLIYGILTARRAGLEAESCINSWPAEKLHGWLASKRQA
ncbi:MAG: DNA polymerase/3'-5' exonuclease PolX [Acidobacteriota bacterium]